MTYGNLEGDMDNIKKAGWYWCAFANITNGPYSKGFGWMEQIASTTTSFIQKVYRYNDAGITQIVVRGYTNAQWYPWRALQTVEFTPT